MYLLRELSKKHKDIWVKVTDGDGQFLLIEAAGALPSWLEPEVADNRVRRSFFCVHCIELMVSPGVDTPW